MQKRQAILNSLSKHPNTRFAKLFHEVDASPTNKNIVLLLIELTQIKDFYVDFNISLQYFLDLYEQLDAANKEFLFNEAGLLIYNAVLVYSRRVDCVHERVEDQLAELSSGQEKTEKNSADGPTPTAVDKPKRRKRLVVEATDPYEIEITSKKFRKLTPTKRFAPGTKLDLSKLYSQNLHGETYTHPALWQYAEIIDLDNDEEYDSKRNYRLFTYHLEHRYNTLVPDINFRLYYKMKDFMDEEDERDGDREFCHNSDWPPLSQAYVKRYIELEDKVLAKNNISGQKEYRKRMRRISASTIINNDHTKLTQESDSGIESSFLQTSTDDYNVSQNESDRLTQVLESSKESGMADSGIGASFLQLSNSDGGDHSLEKSSQMDSGNNDGNISTQDGKTEESEETKDQLIRSIKLEEQQSSSQDGKPEESEEKKDEIAGSIDSEQESTAKETCNGDNEKMETDETKRIEEKIEELAAATIDGDANKTKGIENSESNCVEISKIYKVNGDTQIHETGEENSQKTIALTVRIESDANENCVSTGSRASFSPTNDEGVCLSDIDDTSSIPFTIHVSTTTTFQVQEKNGKEMYTLPKEPIEWPIVLNVFEFPENILKKIRKKRLLTSLGEEMELYLKSRSFKRSRNTTDEKTSNSRRIKLSDIYNIESSSNENFLSRCQSPDSDTDLLGFLDDFEMVTQCPAEGIKAVDLLNSPNKGNNHLRLSRDSGVENDLLTASPEKNSMFFPPIEEESQNDEDLRVNVGGQNEGEKIEILSNVLLTPLNTTPSSLTVVESCDTQVQETCNVKIEETNAEKTNSEEILEQSDEAQLNDNTPQLLNFNFPTICEESNSEISNHKEHNFQLSTDTAAKIQRWHKHLQPILANSRERHHFDVFEIGTKIINEFEEQSNPKNITFQNVMEHQDPSYVSRYFLSTLLLANQGNVELSVGNKSDNKPSEWNDLNLKLISTTRHVVSVEDNIGLVPIKAPESTIVPRVKVQASKAKKRSVSTLNVDLNLDVNRIEIVKPIAKVLRTSTDYDSGIYSNDDMENL